MTELQKVFIANLKQERNSAGLTQEAIAEKIGITHKYYGALELGYKFPSVQTLEKIAKALDIAPYRLFVGRESRTEMDPAEVIDRYNLLLQAQYKKELVSVRKQFLEKYTK